MATQERLAIWMYGRQVATLNRALGRLSLAYTEEAQNTYDVNTPLISISLPVGPKALPHGKAHPFFDGLLPEGETRRMLAYDFRLEVGDTFGLLGELGRDCAGALVILPEGETLPAPGTTEPVEMTEEEVATRLRHLGVEPLGVDKRVRVSLAGLQQKLVLSRLPSGNWTLPIDGRPSTHILKRADPRFPLMVANEAFCLAVCRHLGLRVAAAEVLQASEPILVVSRYDREVTPGGEIRRIHQEDLTQALGIGSAAKYEQRGGPSLRSTARLLRDWTLGSESLDRLLDVTLLNMVLGNCDAHAKNLSLLHHAAGTVQLAPAYDIMATAFYPRVDVIPAMYVNNKKSIHDVSAADVIAEAGSWGLRPNRTSDRIADLLERIPAAIAAAAIEVPTAPVELVGFVRARAAAFAAGRTPSQLAT